MYVGKAGPASKDELLHTSLRGLAWIGLSGLEQIAARPSGRQAGI